MVKWEKIIRFHSRFLVATVVFFGLGLVHGGPPSNEKLGNLESLDSTKSQAADLLRATRNLFRVSSYRDLATLFEAFKINLDGVCTHVCGDLEERKLTQCTSVVEKHVHIFNQKIPPKYRSHLDDVKLIYDRISICLESDSSDSKEKQLISSRRSSSMNSGQTSDCADDLHGDLDALKVAIIKFLLVPINVVEEEARSKNLSIFWKEACGGTPKKRDRVASNASVDVLLDRYNNAPQFTTFSFGPSAEETQGKGTQ